jgi:hypothetical protein
VPARDQIAQRGEALGQRHMMNARHHRHEIEAAGQCAEVGAFETNVGRAAGAGEDVGVDIDPKDGIALVRKLVRE